MQADPARLRLRALAAGDAPALGELFRANDDPATVADFHPFALTAEMARTLASEPGADRFYGVWRGDRLVAFTMLRGWNEGYEVPSFGILVDRSERGLRVGREATILTLDAAHAAGCTRVRLTVEPGNARARRLYRSIGFAPDEGNAMVLDLPYRIPVARPDLGGREVGYVTDALESTHISSVGAYVDRFETEFAKFCQVPHAMTCSNGTVALHLALLGVGVGPGDEVIVPALTYVACANAVTYCGATPVLADVDARTWTLDTDACAAAITPRTRAIMAVHLFGHPCDMDALRALADRHGLALVEDAAEAHGAAYRGRPAGSLGDVATFSFFGNKVVTSGEGGMVTTADPDLAARVRLLRGQGQAPDRRYWHVVRGFNYRMTNVASAIGLAQLERAEAMIARRAEVAGWYAEALAGTVYRLQHTEPWARRTNWMVAAAVDDGGPDTADVMGALEAAAIESRPFFPALHSLPAHDGLAAVGSLPVSERLARRGLCLPTSSLLTRSEVDRVVAVLTAAVAAA